ncbi:MAG TPA: MaoC family dehydratase [Acidimicrobiia bacterium]|nr:MaoC family dehydratase [Acidimicrobiia bacterium]
MSETTGRLERIIDVEAVNAYADATGDRNPIHLDDAAARAAGLDGAIAHGMLGVAVAIELVRQTAGTAIDLRDVRFLHPVPVGSRIVVETDATAEGWTFAVHTDDGIAARGLLTPSATTSGV